MGYAGLVFDFDYTLGDATQAIYAGFCHAFEEMGYPIPDREAVRRTVGLLAVDGFTQLSGDATEAGRSRFYQLFHEVARDLQAKGVVELLPGAVELLSALKQAGIPVGLVSSKQEDCLREVLRSKNITGYFARIVGGGAVKNHKPDPEGLERVLSQLGLAAGEALYCGDTTIDAETARRAGTPFCAVLNGTTPESAFESYPKVHISPDLWDLKAWLEREGTL